MNRREFMLGGLASAAGLVGCRMVPSGASVSLPAEKDYTLTAGDGRLWLSWSGLSAPVRFWVVGDTHLALHDARDAAFAGNYARMAQWPGERQAFEKMFAEAKRQQIDLLVLVGDILSFPTLANVEYVQRTLAASGVPWMYVAGNHDWHFEGDSGSDLDQRARWIEKRLTPLYQGANPLMASRVVKGVRFVMIDNSLYHVLPEQLAFYEAEAAKGDPLCLCLHIPLWVPGWDERFTCGSPSWGTEDPYWQIERRERWSERLTPSTYAFRDAVLATPNLVGVFAGHIHRLQTARCRGQNLFTVPGNTKGDYLDVMVGDWR